MFNECDESLNGELFFFNSIKDKCSIIFDVGCRAESIFMKFNGEVHYFDPLSKFIDQISVKPNNNSKSYFNLFGLSDRNDTLYYYPRYESFYNRIESCGTNDENNKIELEVKKGSEYIQSKNIEHIDFVKIDTEGHELSVLKGFENEIHKIGVIQFEYGGTYLDSNIKFIDVINYLKSHNFDNFSYLDRSSQVPITDYSDHYKYCNIVCYNKEFMSKYL